MGYTIDATDWRIITLLRLDERISNVNIVRTIGAAEATARKRIDRLLSEGVMRIVALPVVAKLGLEVETVIMLKVDLGREIRLLYNWQR